MSGNKHRILVLGIGGMLGSTFYKYLSQTGDYELYGSARNLLPIDSAKFINKKSNIFQLDVENIDLVGQILHKVLPDTVINCVGLIKQVNYAGRLDKVIEINSLLPHRLALECNKIGSKLIHISTDCVFSGNKGEYVEEDRPDAVDIYGLSKLLGEVTQSHHLTVRTSIIGHELQSKNGLVEWFLSQIGGVNGYKSAFFSGITTLDLADIFDKYILRADSLKGLYHISTNKISKYELLKIIATVYEKKINIGIDTNYVIDRTLDSSKFLTKTGYVPQSWELMIERMKKFHEKYD